MTYALIASNLAWLSLALLLFREWRRDRNYFYEREDELRTVTREREDELMTRIQAPKVAITRSIAAEDHEPAYIPGTDDFALAQFEDERFPTETPS